MKASEENAVQCASDFAGAVRGFDSSGIAIRPPRKMPALRVRQGEDFCLLTD
jgi:hypothetical protein